MVTRVTPSIYIIIIIISLPLNALAVVTFICRIQERKPAEIYMVHLACVDLLFTLLLPLKIHYRLNGSDWVFGEAACRLLSAAYYGNMSCSILLMMCMSVDRLLGVAFPVASLTWRSARKATCVCLLIGLLALIGIVPLLSMKQTIRIENVGISCSDTSADPVVMIYLLVFLTFLFIAFFLLLVVILLSYSIILYVLCAKPDHLVTSSSSSDNRRKAAIMATAVLTEFVVCFAPSNSIMLYHLVTCLVTRTCRTDTYLAYKLAVCLGSSSVFLNPLLYYYSSSQYREQIRSVFWVCKEKTANIT
ncbi:proteinase-activated receptor 1-like [Garra rufa]|uniref:proteinase-activated receptor 1-like n=1 Tax=Garra rufa TaxID=137080 RepID=UPI003CCEEE6C